MVSFESLRIGLLCLLAVPSMTPLAHAVAPAAPSNCTAVTFNRTATAASIRISWNDNSTNETQWKIQVSVGTGAYSELATISSTTTLTTGDFGVTWSAASLDIPYHFKIMASNGTELSQPSNIATVGTYDLREPINLSVTAVDPFNVMMSWEEGSTSEDGFAIEMKAGTGAWQYLGAVGANVLSLSPLNLIEPLTSYSFRVRAYKGSAPSTPDSPAGANVSPYSNESLVASGPYTLSAAAAPGQALINLAWPNILNEAGYKIYYKSAGQDSYTFLTTRAADVTTYQITSPNIESAMAYSILVLPVNGSGVFMGESNVVTVTVDGITSKTGSSGTPGSAFVHTFTHVSSATVSSRTVTGLPATLTFDSASGGLGGVLPAVGNYTLNYTVNLSIGGSLTQAFSLRVRPPAGPPLVGTPISGWTSLAGTSRDTPLAGTFSDPEAESAVRVSTTLGSMDFILFDTATPATVANFMSYVNTGKFAEVVFHRSVTDFVIQGGGFKGTGTGDNFTSVVTNPPVINEPGIANTRGTVSMAKVGGNPNSATSQFFVSMGDNTANLDYQNGGFTVFGRVAGNGMTVADAINAEPKATYNLFLDGSPTATPFADFPMHANIPPESMDQTKLLKINSITPVATLGYSITGNTNPSVAEASIVGGQLHLTGLSGGQTTVTVAATDLDNQTTTQDVLVMLTDTYTTWAGRSTFPNNQNAAGQNPDGDSLTNLQEYAFFGNPAAASPSPLPVSGKTGIAPAAQYQTLSFALRKFTTGLSYVVEANNQLTGTWSPVWSSADGLAHARVVSTTDLTDLTLVTIKDSVALGSQARRFMRVRVVQE